MTTNPPSTGTTTAPTNGTVTTTIPNTFTGAGVNTTYVNASSTITAGSGITTGGGWGNWSTVTNSTSILLKGNDPKIVIDEGEIDLKELMFLMREMREKLCLLEENLKKHEDYPALQSIYDQYRVVEAMVRSEEE